MKERKHIAGVDIGPDYLLGLREVVFKTRTKRVNIGSLSGNTAGRKRGRGSIFYDVRPWTLGDDIRHIDSHKTAKTGIPHIRNFHEERENKTLLIADFRPSMFFGTRRALRSVVAAEVISLVGWRAVLDRTSIGVFVATAQGATFLGWANDGKQFAALVDKISELYQDAKDAGPAHDPEMDELMATVLNSYGSASILVATSLDAPGNNFDKIVGLMAKRREIIFLMISDKFERTPPPGVYPYRTSGGESGRFRITRDLSRKPINDWPFRLSCLGAKSLGVDAELDPQEIARVLDQLYDRPR